MTSTSSKKDENDKGTAYFWKSTSIEPQISSLNLRHGISKVALGNEHTVILTYNSDVFAVGENFYGQLGFGDQTRRAQTTLVTELAGKNVVDIACGAYHSAAVCDNGELFCWGDSSNGQCGIGDIKSTNVPTLVAFHPALSPTLRPRSRPVDSEDAKILIEKLSSDSQSLQNAIKIKEVACGEGHTLALTSGGRVWSWGVGCQTGHGVVNECIREPREVEGLIGRYVTAIRCGAYHSIALVKDSSIHPKLIPQRNSRIQGSSGKKRSKRLRRFNRSKESTKGLKKTQSLLENPEISPKGPITDIRRIHVNTSPKTYLSYDPISESNSQMNVAGSEDSLQDSEPADLDTSASNVENSIDSGITQLNDQETELDNPRDKDKGLKDEAQDRSIHEKDCLENIEKEGSCKAPDLESQMTEDDGRGLVEAATASSDDTMRSLDAAASADDTVTADAISCIDDTPSDTITSGKPQTASESIPINRLSIHDNHYGFPEIRQSKHFYLEGSSPEPSPPQPGFLEPRHFNHVTNDLFVTTDVSGSLCESSTLFESVEPGSLMSIKSGGTDSDPEEVSPTVEEKSSPASSSYLGFGILTSRFRQEMDLGKLTSAVYDSVTGMFMSSASTIIPSSSDKSLTQEESCASCGTLGICICNGKIAENEKKFSHKGYDTEVWTWGRGGCGQLGHGDTDDRSVPSCVEGLRGIGIIKIAAGTFHSLALTIYCQVFSWGDNSCGQLGHKKPMAVKPRKVKCFSDVLIWDIACGSHYSLFIGDMALNRPDVYVCGRQPSEMPVIAAALNKLQGASGYPLSQDDIALKTANKSKPPLTHSRSFDDVKERSFGAVRVELVRLIMFRKVGSVRCVLAQNEHCCCIADSDASGVLEVLGELSGEERLFYYQLALIWQAVLVPVIQSELWSLMVPQESGSVLVPVVQAYLELMKCVSSSMMSVTKVIQAVTSMDTLFDACLSEEFVTAFERYSEVFSNAVAYGVFMLFTSLANDVGPQCKAVLRDLLEDADKDFIGYMEAFQWVARVPLIRMQHYVVLTNKLLTLLPKEDPRNAKLQHISEIWKTLTWQDEKRYLVAEQTRQFWEDCPSKITETFKVPNRRLLRSSKTHPLFPSKSARFSSPIYVLFDDYFVHIQSNKNYQALPLNTLWAVSLENSESLINAIKIISPEETLLVCAPSAEDKTDWLLTINQAIARVISKTTAYRLGKDAVNLTTGNLPAATAREATYTFVQDTRYKAATYSGMWLTGKPHGRGEMVWTDGRRYTGEFNQGLHDGEGIMVFPVSVPENPAERYEGHWMGGKMTGYGRMRYTNGDTYVGHWLDNMRHGHGTMKCGALSSSAASVYIGEWLYNKRHGYGTLDDVLKGEKYMGMWENDSRHGPGIIVTLEGIYTQGNFVQNKLMGAAQLVCDDNTFFDGEFAGHCQLAGKGTLTLPNGDVIDGTFSGQWGDGIKINGTYLKRESDSNSKGKSVLPEVKPVISPDQKWTALFRQCREALGCHGDRDADPQTVWKCISMTLLNGHNGKLPRTEQDIMQELLNVNNEMERTGNHCLDNKALQNYLAKAFEISYHPLGQLVTSLVDVYRATYVGMGTHRRLLSHAVLEAKSIIHRLYNIVRLLFVDLPNEEYVHLDKDCLGGVSNLHTEMSTSSSALLHPIVLPLLYPPLFTLYALHNERADSVYWERLLQLNWRSDLALMTYVGVKRQFWLASENETDDYDDEIMGENREAHHYASAIEALQQISTKLSPMEKLAVLKTTFEKINEEVHSFWKGEEKLISLDDLFPVFQFVTIRARIPHMGSEIHFIDDMVDSHVHVGEQGHMFTTLKACFFQIQNEKG